MTTTITEEEEQQVDWANARDEGLRALHPRETRAFQVGDHEVLGMRHLVSGVNL
jgi:hypothetical protein